MDAEKLLELEGLRVRVRELEHRVRVLRTSRRILMNLLSRLEQDRRDDIARLEQEQAKLKRRNARYAKLVLERHRHVSHLERLLAEGEVASAGRDERQDRRNELPNDVQP